MRALRFSFVVLVMSVLAACGTEAPAASPTAETLGTRFEVTLTDDFKMAPASLRVPAGKPLTFVVTNDGLLDHEFFIGDETAQASHEAEMKAMGGMQHDEAMGIAVKAGETKELSVTLEAGGEMIAGCHVTGHYAAGMKAMIEVAS